MSASIFLGLVTHRGTRFPDSSTDTGLVRELARELRNHGLNTMVVIEDRDAFDPVLHQTDRAAVLRSITAELRLERDWRLFLDPTTRRGRLGVTLATRRIVRALRFAPPWRRRLDEQDPGPRMVRRLVNIELAHVSLMRSAADSQSDWVLIVEDDAWTDDIPGFALDLASFVARHANDAAPLYVNASRSFSRDDLRVNHLLGFREYWDASRAVEALEASRPITNTVCAILYRGTFLSAITDIMEAIPTDPVVPIDWKLNLALMQATDRGVISAGDAWTLMPAPLLQRSMRTSLEGATSND